MSLDIIHGKAKNILAVRELTHTLGSLNITGTLYIGYPILALADESFSVDALLIAESIGLLVFHIPNSQDPDLKTSDASERLRDIQDNLFNVIENSLGRHLNLKKRRELAVAVNVVSYIPDLKDFSFDKSDIKIAEKRTLKKVLSECNKTDPEYMPALNAAIQRVTTIKPRKKRADVKNDQSKGAILKNMEKEIANLDLWQKQAAIETPDGPQRVRGLAGSGKTVILALKAAYLHSQHPEWNIVITFHTRSLYQQFSDLIRRFSFEHSNDEPDWNKLKILHAWGSRSQPGLYSEIASASGFPIRDYLYGKTKYGMQKAFEGVCNELLLSIRNREMPLLYDAVLIDEAQDLPDSFFKIIYKFLTLEKRVVWAYDELQNLSDYSTPPAEALFGENEFNQPNVRLVNSKDEPHQDIILPVCYRNTPWALTLAHALGFGIYRKDDLVQLFDDNSLWDEIGYKLTGGQFQPETNVVLKRKESSYPKYFEELLSPCDAVSCHCFESFDEEINWIADQVLINIQEDELDADDILIILPDAWTAKSKANLAIRALDVRGIPAHLAGVSGSAEEIFVPGSVSIADIYMAKRNEAPMVYVANSDYCSGGPELIKLRNTLYTAITRSRSWVRISGSGTGMDVIRDEFDALLSRDFTLDFRLPDEAETHRLRTVNRDRTSAEKAKIRHAEDVLKQLIEFIKKNELNTGSLSPQIRQGLVRILGEPEI